MRKAKDWLPESAGLITGFLTIFCMAGALIAAERPNIVFILADDLGYGDVKCLNPEGKIPTLHIDKLGKGGMIFTDAHSTSSVCSPSRYSIITGRYNWRSRMKYGVLNGFSPRLVEKDRMSIAAFLRGQGYATACIGKWHLGMDWPQNDGTAPGSSANPRRIDYTKPIEGGPNSLGFDYYFGISASLDMLPYVFIENDRVTELPTVEKGWSRKGPSAPGFEGVDVLPTLVRKATGYIDRQASRAKQGMPFFLYLPLTSPHTPILPSSEWQGKSGINKYADFVMQTDAAIGTVMDALDRNDLAHNTLVIVTSDNGCSGSAGFPVLMSKGHNPNFKFRGSKSDIWEGGHRIPFIARWPAGIKAGTTCSQTVCQVDFFATCAGILGKSLPDHTAEDSINLLPALSGTAEIPLRESTVHSAIFGAFAIRQGKWKLILGPDSGGWSDPKPGSAEASKMPPFQLYDLETDIGETTNLQSSNPEIVNQLKKLLEKYVADGRSTPGAPQPNTGTIDIISKRAAKPSASGIPKPKANHKNP